jgi:RimJ/RimL family protein N-acetyltransferase
VLATVFEGNEASKRVLLNAGFVFEAHFSKTLWKNGVALDEWVYGFRKR